MKPLIILEVGDLTGIFVMIIAMIIGVAFVISLVIGGIYKLIYEARDDKKLSKGQFWSIVLVCMLLCGIISGMICGGMM